MCNAKQGNHLKLPSNSPVALFPPFLGILSITDLRKSAESTFPRSKRWPSLLTFTRCAMHVINSKAVKVSINRNVVAFQ